MSRRPARRQLRGTTTSRALLAEAIDVLFACEDDPKEAALLLGCSPTQLIRFLKEAPRAIVAINERRRQAGRHPLK